MVILIATRFLAFVLEFTLVDRRITSLCFLVVTMVFANKPNSSSGYPPFLESLEQVLENAPTRDSVDLLGDFNTHMGYESETSSVENGRNRLPDFDLSSVQGLPEKSV